MTFKDLPEQVPDQAPDEIQHRARRMVAATLGWIVAQDQEFRRTQTRIDRRASHY